MTTLNKAVGYSNMTLRPYTLRFYSEFIRICYYLIAVVVSLVTQYIHPYFINNKIWIPVYLIVFVALLYHLVNIIFFLDQNKSYNEKLSFFIDAIFIAAVIYLTYFSYPIFTILFLLNIAMCSFLYGKNQSLILTGFTVFLYSICYVKGYPDFSSLNILPYFLNLLAFFAVSNLSGLLGDLYLDKDRQLKQTQKNLSDLQDFSDIVIQNIGTGLITLDSEQKVSYVNQAAKKIFSGELNEGYIKDILKSLHQKQGMTFREEIDFIIDGKKKYLEIISTHLDLPQSEWILLLQDLTEIKELEKELSLKEKLAAIGQLAGGIAHEIRNPLASISGSVEMLQQTIDGLSPENQKLFSIIIKEIDRLNTLITEFLSFVRPEVIRADKCQIKTLVEDILALMKYNKDLTNATVIESDFEECTLLCDKGKLKQALINIIVNGLQAIKDTPQAKLKCTGKVQGRFYTINFEDNGPGIPEDIISKVFEPFYTTKAKGTGLGLAITHRIIEGHHGEIKVSSVEKKGTTFFIKLPIE